MSKSLQSKTQKTISELHKDITKNLDVIELPQHKDPNFKPETKEEWLKEIEYEESLMTQEEKDEADKRSQQFWARMKQLYPSKCKGISA